MGNGFPAVNFAGKVAEEWGMGKWHIRGAEHGKGAQVAVQSQGAL